MEINYPSKVMSLSSSYWQAKVVLAASKLKLFTLLGDKKLNREEIRKQLKLHGRGLSDFLDALYVMELLTANDDSEVRLYGNTEETRKYMVEGSPFYIGGALDMFNDRFVYMSRLEEALQTGECQNSVFTGQSLFDDVYSTEEKLMRFANGMKGLQLPAFVEFSKRFDFSAYKTLTDIGGSLGILSTHVAKNNENISCLTLDLPYILEAAKENLKNEGVSDRVEAGVINFFEEDFPKSDIITMGMILHDWDLEKKELLVRKAYDALDEGGIFIVIENIIDDKREKHLFALLFSIIMLVETENGFDFTFADFDGWVKKAGFKKTKLMHLAGPTHAIIAYK